MGVKISPAAGSTGMGEIERRRKKIFYLRAKTRTVYFILINYKAKFCGRSPRERVNHVYLVLYV